VTTWKTNDLNEDVNEDSDLAHEDDDLDDDLDNDLELELACQLDGERGRWKKKKNSTPLTAPLKGDCQWYRRKTGCLLKPHP
jgi:hypothetical protein